MPNTSKPMEEELAQSPRLYAFPFKSAGDRFSDNAPEKESKNLFYEVKTFDTSTAVAQSPRKFTHIFRKPKESTGSEAEVRTRYNTDCGDNKTLATSMLDSPRRFAFNYTDQRFKHKPAEVLDRVYDVNVLHKAGLDVSIAQSPRKYSSMKSKVDRDTGNVGEVHGDYNPHNGEMGHVIANSPRRYAIMKSAVARDKGQTKVLHPAVYKTDVLHLAGVADLARTKPGCKSTFMASPRKPLMNATGAPDKHYDVDNGMWRGVVSSPRKYSNMAHSGRTEPGATSMNIAKDLMYETEDVPVKPTLVYGIKRTPLLYSQMGSSTPRFKEVENTAAQAVYDWDSCPKGEGTISKRIMESPRRYFGAQSKTDRSMASGGKNSLQLLYNPQVGRDGSSMTLEETIKKTPIAYSGIRSAIPRFKTEKKAVTTDEYELLLRNPDKIDLKFQIRGNIVVKKTSDRAQLVVGRQAPVST